MKIFICQRGDQLLILALNHIQEWLSAQQGFIQDEISVSSICNDWHDLAPRWYKCGVDVTIFAGLMLKVWKVETYINRSQLFTLTMLFRAPLSTYMFPFYVKNKN